MNPISVDEHRAAILAGIAATPTETVGLDDARERVLACDVTARTAIPPFPNSAMDGYAVRAADIAAAGPDTPVTLPVVADIPAGRTDELTIDTGTAARIMTGAPMPAGADTIVQVEITDGGTEQVTITQVRSLGTHVRGAGEDLVRGDRVLTAGTRLTARHLGALAAAGHGEALVHRRPRVAVLSTGSELVHAGQAPGYGQIPDSNSHVIAATVAEAGGVPIRLDAVADSEDVLRAVLADLGDVDAVIASGGVSVGAYDVVKAVLEPLPTMWFGAVRMQPGKPQGWGRLAGGQLVLALPGNPVSVWVSMQVFGNAALRTLGGEADVDPVFIPAVAAVPWSSPADREQYMPVRIAHDGVAPLVYPASRRGSGSHLVGGLAGADGLARIAAEVTEVAAGDRIHVLEALR